MCLGAWVCSSFRNLSLETNTTRAAAAAAAAASAAAALAAGGQTRATVYARGAAALSLEQTPAPEPI